MCAQFYEGRDALADDMRVMLVRHGCATFTEAAALTKYHVLRAAYFMIQGAVASHDDGRPLTFAQSDKAGK